MSNTQTPTGVHTSAPERAPLVLGTLILVSGVANLNLSVANVALPSIGEAFDSSQTTLNLIAVGYSLGLATSVLYLGAVGDRHGRKLLMMLGTLLSVPACLLAAYAWTDGVLVVARIFGGLAAGMAYPTTLALITALWSGGRRTKAIALWSALGGAIASLGPLVAGWLLEHFWWGSVFLVTLPLAVIALVMAWRFVPAHVNESTEPVDNLGGILSAVLVAGLVLSINFAPVPGKGTLVLTLAVITLVAGVAFVWQQRRAANPLYDLKIARRPTFWVSACAGIIVFGSLMGAAFVSQQFLQNVLGYTTIEAGAAFLPTIVLMVLVAPRSAVLVETHGARTTLLLGYVFLLLAFLWMLLLWEEDSPVLEDRHGVRVHSGGVDLAGTPASHSLTGSVPVRRARSPRHGRPAARPRWRDHAVRLRRPADRGYASAFATAIGTASGTPKVSPDVQAELTKSFAGAEQVAQQHPKYAEQITAAAKSSFLQGDDWAYSAGVIAIVLGAVLVFVCFPRKEAEQQLLRDYHAEARPRAAPGAVPAVTRG